MSEKVKVFVDDEKIFTEIPMIFFKEFKLDKFEGGHAHGTWARTKVSIPIEDYDALLAFKAKK